MSVAKTDVARPMSAVKADVEGVLEAFYRERQAAAYELDGRYGRLWEVMHKLHAAGGKRLRPYLMLTAYEGAGGRDYESALRVAAALELLHTSMLIHDDVIDRDDRRHGELNVTGWYGRYYRGNRHYADGTAILAGDLALSSAYQLVLTSDLSAEDKLLAQALLGEAVFVVAGGELLDVEASMEPMVTVDSLKVALLKTSSYSFIGPLEMGARLAGAGQTTLTPLQAYGRALGIAFQLADDLLGLFGDEAVTGKSTITDIKEGKPTYVMQQAMVMASAAEQEELQGILGRDDVAETQAKRVRSIVEACGAKAKTQQLMEHYAQEARVALDGAALTTAALNALIALTSAATRRQR